MKKLTVITKNMMPLLRLTILSNFPKLYPRINPRVFIASLKITENCNLKCPSCNFHKIKKKEMDYYQWIEVIDQLKKNKIKNIRFSGGEPLIRPDIFELLYYAKKHEFRISLQSNIILLDNEKILKLAEIGVDNISISIDGINKDYKKSRGKDSFARVNKHIYTLRKYFTDNISITPNLSSETINGLYNVVEFAKECNIPVVGFNLVNFTHYFFDNEYNKKAYHNLDSVELKKFLRFLYHKRSKYVKVGKLDLYVIHKYFKDYRMKDLPCLNPIGKICIGSNGNVYGCCSQTPVGNLSQHTLKDIINSKRMKEVRISALQKTCPGCSCFISAEKFNLKYWIASHVFNFL